MGEVLMAARGWSGEVAAEEGMCEAMEGGGIM